MKLKRTIAVLSLVAALILSVTGCGAAPEDKKNNSSGSSESGAVEQQQAPKKTIPEQNEEITAYAQRFDRDMTAALGIDADGKIFLFEDYGYDQFGAVLEWKDIIQVSVGYNLAAGLDRSGKVHVVPAVEEMWEFFDLSSFTDVVAISTGDNCVYGLKKDGTVVATGEDTLDVSAWSNVKQISASDDLILGICNDGSILTAFNPADTDIKAAEQWTDVIQVSAGRLHAVGLKKDGTVVVCGSPLFPEKGDHGEFNVSDWSDVVYVSADNQTTIGLKADGTLVQTGYNVSDKAAERKNIICVWQGDNLVITLQKDGTLTNGGLADDFKFFK